MKMNHWLLTTIFFGLPLSAVAQGVPQSFTYDGRLMTTGGTAVLDPAVVINLKILDSSKACVLYEESQTVDTTTTNGQFTLQVGSVVGAPKRTGQDPGNAMSVVFRSAGVIPATNPGCTSGYAVVAGAGRHLRVTVTPTSGGAEVLSPDMAMNSAPSAFVADSVQGYGPTDFVRLGAGQLTQATVETVFSSLNYPKLTALLDGSSTQFARSSPTSGQSLPVLAGNATTPTAGSIWFDSSTGQMKYFDGSSAIALTGSSSGGAGGVSTLNGLTAMNQSFATAFAGTAPTFSSSGSVHTLSIPYASGTSVTGGLISRMQFDDFSSKLSSSLSAGRIFVGNGSNIATAVQPSGDVAFTAAGVTTVNALHGQLVDPAAPSDGQVFRWNSTTKWTPAFLSMADVRSTTTPSNTIFPTTSCTAGQTLNWSSLTDSFTCTSIQISDSQIVYGSGVSMGLVFAGPSSGGAAAPTFRQLTASDLPAGSASQWTTSGSNISYGTGSVGIGTVTPTDRLTIFGNGSNASLSVTDPTGTAGGSSANLSTYGSTNSANLNFFRYRGSMGSPAVVQANDALGVIRFLGRGSAPFQGAHIGAYADDTFSSTSAPAFMAFSTTASGSTVPTTRMTIASNGNVGIGSATPAYKLDVTGDMNASGVVRANGAALSSDVRFKKNIETIAGSLEKILNLRGVRYDWKRDEFPNKHFNARKQIGLIAQEVDEQFPELVETGADGYKSVNYPALVAPLVEATRELNIKIETLETENRHLKAVLEQQARDLELIKTRLGL